MTPEVIQKFIESGRPVRLTWDRVDGSKMSSDSSVLLFMETVVVTRGGRRIPVDSITSISSAGAAADDGGAR